MKIEDKIFLGFLIFAIVLMIILSIANFMLIKKIGEEPELIIKENPKVCYMPRACYETENEYLEQFPGKEIPEILYECLIHCYKDPGIDLPKIKYGGQNEK